MTWQPSLTEEVRLEFVSAQRRGRAVFDRSDADPLVLEPRVDVVDERPRRRIVSGRSAA